MGSQDLVAYWNVNIPEAEHTEKCPAFLDNVSVKDQLVLAMPDSTYTRQTWDEVRRIVRENRLDEFKRVPSHLRRYRAFTSNLARDHGSVANFILRERLGWEAPVRPEGDKPFACPTDIKVLYNDWPYGIDVKIVHLVVWTKFVLEVDPASESGDMTDQARGEIQDYVAKTFYPRVPEDQVIWFKNWAALKSVGAVEHFHVMMYDPDPDFVREITNGDVPLIEKSGSV
ncbi:Protein of unknown function (DUF3605) [Geosmithia morbida]|uniref:N-acetylglucosamine-induced protein 1 n=1 Tax=Geosmithia morbida TaxID=1094350 RepID=A0A9P4YY67_9HYPO|nr:Protein of unknown function (DUF3605) [Geosmithia morbida]KAF4123967.1 Protein of unknown function (DUF3605) [Geosmithia morbida]